MGLAVTIGCLADALQYDEESAEMRRAEFAAVNAVLREHNLPQHTEPEQLPEIHYRHDAEVGYSELNHLRRFYAHAIRDPSREPLAISDEKPYEDPILMEETEKMSSHLLCHSDAEGFYLPIDFKDVIEDDGSRIPGGLLGSSYRLMEELVFIAPKLGIELQNGSLSDAEASRILDCLRPSTSSSETSWWRRIIQTIRESNNEIQMTEIPVQCKMQTAWLALFETARLSIKHGTAINFE